MRRLSLLRSAFLGAFTAGLLSAAADPGQWAPQIGGTVTRNAAGQITGLNFRSTWIGDDDLTPVATVKTLRVLDLSHTRITDLGFQKLKDLPAVEELNLYYAEQVGDGVLTVIKNWPKLRKVNLRGTQVTDLGVAQLANHPSLESLDVGYSLFTDNGFEPMTSMPKLRSIAVGGNKVTDVGLNVVRLIPGLTGLDLAGAQRTDSGMWAATITDRGLETIGQLKGLRELNLRASKITDAGINRIAGLTALESLDLGQTNLSAAGLEPVGKLASLVRLSLWKCARVDDPAIASLSQLKRLRWLDIEGTAITAEGAARLQAALPECRIQK